MKYVFNETVIGASHIRKNTVCEDASKCCDESLYKIIAVSDGHGDKACFRSDSGSSLAVECACAGLKEFADIYLQEKSEGRSIKDKLLSNYDRESVIRQLIQYIIQNWRNAVELDLNNNTFTEEESVLIENKEINNLDKHILYHIYGATLIAALYIDNLLIMIQQGDGRCFILNDKGEITEPIPWDERCVGNICTSLCQDDAIASTRYEVMDFEQNHVVVCALETDGIEDSFDTKENSYLSVCNQLVSLHLPEDNLNDCLRQVLSDWSQKGSQDDMSIAAIVDTDKIPFVQQIISQKWRARLAEIRKTKALDELGEMKRKYSFLKKEYEEEKAIIEAKKKRATDIEAQIDQLNNKIKSLNSMILFHKNEVDALLQKKKAVIDELQKENAVLRIKEREWLEFDEKYCSIKRIADDAEQELDEMRVSDIITGQRPQVSKREITDESLLLDRIIDIRNSVLQNIRPKYPWND